MRRRDFIRLLGGVAMDVCIDCMNFVASGGRTGLEHQPEWSLAAISARWGPEWVLVSLGGRRAKCAAARGLVLAFRVSRGAPAAPSLERPPTSRERVPEQVPR